MEIRRFVQAEDCVKLINLRISELMYITFVLNSHIKSFKLVMGLF